jgi:outer membrane protein TolC
LAAGRIIAGHAGRAASALRANGADERQRENFGAPAPSTTATVNTLSPSVQVQGAYAGSTPGVAKMPFSGKLGLREAIQRGLAYNLGQTGATQALRQAQGQSKVALSNLLPNFSGTVNENVQTTDLEGLRFPIQFSRVRDSRR